MCLCRSHLFPQLRPRPGTPRLRSAMMHDVRPGRRRDLDLELELARAGEAGRGFSTLTRQPPVSSACLLPGGVRSCGPCREASRHPTQPLQPLHPLPPPRPGPQQDITVQAAEPRRPRCPRDPRAELAELAELPRLPHGRLAALAALAVPVRGCLRRVRGNSCRCYSAICDIFSVSKVGLRCALTDCPIMFSTTCRQNEANSNFSQVLQTSECLFNRV